MNQHALNELVEAAKEIAFLPHVRDVNGGLMCLDCGALFSDEQAMAWDDAKDETGHDDDCPWRLLREALANLDNEGY